MKKYFLSLLIAHISGFVFAQGFKNHATYVALDWDNDVFSSRNKTDANYTNGIRLSVMSSGGVAQNKWMFNWLLFNAPKHTHSMNGWQFGQDMFTPKDLNQTDPRFMERPYAGYTFLKFQRVSASRRTASRIYSSNSIGLFGKNSRAACVQRFIHNDLNLGEPPQGWENGSVRSELILLDYQFTYETRLLSYFANGLNGAKSSSKIINKPIHQNFDVISFLNARMGQVKNEVGAGLLIKLGWFNNHFLSTLPNYENDNTYRYRLDSLTSMNSYKGKVLSNWKACTELGRFKPHQVYIFARPLFSMVASNSFLQGGLINSILEKPEPANTISNNQLNRYLPGLDYGFVVSFNWISFSYSTCYRFPEFQGGTPHKWGNFSIAYLY